MNISDLFKLIDLLNAAILSLRTEAAHHRVTCVEQIGALAVTALVPAVRAQIRSRSYSELGHLQSPLSFRLQGHR
jgi:hypothetical protein